MQDPKAIIEQAKSGTVPDAWSVTRPRGGYPLLAALRTGFIALVVVFVVGVSASLALIAWFDAALGGVGQIENLPQMYAVPAIAGVVAFLVVVAVIAGMRAAGNAPWSFLVFTPEGLVQSLGPTKITALDFAAIADVTQLLRIQVTQNQGGGSSTSTQAYAMLHYRDGHTVRWHPNWRFGSDQVIVGHLVNAHQRYRTLVNPGGNPV
jgi:hypothetical protein